MEMGTPGKRRKGRLGRRWIENTKEGMRDMGLEKEDTGERRKS